MSRWIPSTHEYEKMVFYLLINLLMSRHLIMTWIAQEFWVRFPSERNQGKQGATLCSSTGFLTGPKTREVLRLLFLQAHPGDRGPRFTAAGMSSQCNQSDSFRFKHAAFYQSLKSKVGLAAAKAAALRINLNVEGCVIVAGPVYASFRAPLLLPLLLSHRLPLPRVH